MTLNAAEFIRRFLMHVLPTGFHRIRHYGLFASPARTRNIDRAASCWPCLWRRPNLPASRPTTAPKVLRLSSMSLLRRPDDRHRNLRGRASCALAIAERIRIDTS